MNNGTGIYDQVWAIDEETLVASVHFDTSFMGSVESNSTGLGWDGGSKFWYCNNASDFNGGGVFLLSFDGTVEEKFTKPDNQPTSPGDDGSFLYVGDFASDNVYKMDRSDGTVLATFGPYSDNVWSVTWDPDRNSLWLNLGSGLNAVRIDPSDGSVLETSSNFSHPRPRTFSYHDGLLWGQNNGTTIFTIDPDTYAKTTVGTYNADSLMPPFPSDWGFVKIPDQDLGVPPMLRLRQRNFPPHF